MIRTALLSLAALALMPVATAQAQADTVDASTQSEIARAEQHGRQIYDSDQAAWHSTDRMMELLPKSDMQQIRGWVVIPDGTSQKVTYYGELAPDGRRSAIFIAWMNGQKMLSHKIPAANAPIWLSDSENAMATATAVVRGQGAGICYNTRANTVTLPPSSDGTVDVYLMTPQTEANIYPFGGHTLFTVRPDGSIAAKQPFTKGCANLPVEAWKSPKSKMTGISHVLASTPTEIHVWTSLWAKARIIVMTDNEKTLWLVDSGKITLITRKGAEDQEALKRVLG